MIAQLTQKYIQISIAKQCLHVGGGGRGEGGCKFASVCRRTWTHLFALLFFFDPQDRKKKERYEEESNHKRERGYM